MKIILSTFKIGNSKGEQHMPYIKFYNLDNQSAALAAKDAVSGLSEVSGAPADKFLFFNCGEKLPINSAGPAVYVEIEWYARSAEVMRAAAEIITDAVKKHGDFGVNIIFRDIASPDNHYINGEPYKKR